MQRLAAEVGGVCHARADHYVLVLSATVQALPDALVPYAREVFPMDTDAQLCQRSYGGEKRSVSVNGLSLGGTGKQTALMVGPCAVEDEEQLHRIAAMMHRCRLKILRAGCYKPRTSPYSFQGLGLEGLKMLDSVRRSHDLAVVTEVRDTAHIDQVLEYADIVQIGTKAMFDPGILRACGASNKPILLKRSFGATLQEFLQAGEFILSAGNERLMLCERGIRTFETATRFTLDLCSVAYLKAHVSLPVIIDPSHAMGHAYGVPDLSRAAMAMGVDGLLIEVHPNPARAHSDAAQQLDIPTFEALHKSLHSVAKAVGRIVV